MQQHESDWVRAIEFGPIRVRKAVDGEVTIVVVVHVNGILAHVKD